MHIVQYTCMRIHIVLWSVLYKNQQYHNYYKKHVPTTKVYPETIYGIHAVSGQWQRQSLPQPLYIIYIYFS